MIGRQRVRMRRGRCMAMLVVVLLAGCAGTARTIDPIPPAPAYVPPAAGPSATLLVRVTQPGGQSVVATFEQPVSCSRRREIRNGTAATSPERISTRLAAGRLQTVSFSYRNGRQACEVTLSFEPVRDRSYLLRAGVEATRCSMDLIDTTTASQVPAVQREPLGFARPDNACTPLTTTVLPARDAASQRRPSIEDFRQLLPTP